ncbi:MAG: tRNA (N6-isopentenyl adenosine(37)-C2)-methylthiotransferase MiaB [Alphaproteobacteria bacterium]|nr:tRNA (N6-isopentenyl adenosine(37)-C2)-methylthiotransferase MiaB [Alphaproteobacteria bacterium]
MTSLSRADRRPTLKVFMKTWGCQMNVYDSQRMLDVVAPLGYGSTDDVAEADLVIFNTCHIREKATEKLFSELGRLRPHQQARAQKGGRMLIAIGGCVAQAVGEEIQRRAPYVDLVFGPQTYHLLPEMIARASRLDGKVLNTDFPPEPKFDHLPEERVQSGVCAFLSVQEGCDRFCSYCVVPYTRGAEYSRPTPSIVAEAEKLVQGGAREITLLGQNVNAWHDEDGWKLGRLLRRLAEIPDLKRLRYATSYPSDMDDDLIAAHRDTPQLMPYLHLPVQSGADPVLAAMNRKHTSDDYRRLVDKLRAARPDLALSSDFIVGFPGETEADHEATMRLAREVGFALAYSFKYSRRPGTPAASLPGQIKEDVKDARLQELQALLSAQQEAFNQACVGKTMPVLFEDISRRAGQMFGHTPYMQNIHARGPSSLLGQEVETQVISAQLNSLAGKLTGGVEVESK